MNWLYHKSPIFIQNFLISLYGYYWKKRRFGKEFKEDLAKWKERETYSEKDWLLYQTNELRKLLVHSFDTVPYYHRVYKEHGFKREDFLNFELEDLKSLPYLEKEDLRKYGKTELLSKKRNKGRFYASSGSTGTPVNIYISKEFHRKWNAAYEVRVRNWAGVNYKMARGMIGGRKILKNDKSKGPFYRFNSAEKQTYFSAYHISEKNVSEYLKAFEENKIEYLVGYAMSNYFLADFIEKSGLKAPKLKAVITSSEKLTPEMRATFKRVYGCKTFDSYSGVESCGLISEDDVGNFLFSPDTGIIEVLNKNLKEVSDGDLGEVVSTGLLNFDQPLIRYRIGDSARKSKDQIVRSNIAMPVFDEIMGRVEDVIITSDGKKMVRFHSIFIDIVGLVFGQIVQKSMNDFALNLVVGKNYDKTISERILKKRMNTQLGEITIKINYLDEAPKNNNGKFRAVISEVVNE
ncbi:MAG: phenylacetate--CoA ligase family protein [Flavobacteriaceae bacterium]